MNDWPPPTRWRRWSSRVIAYEPRLRPPADLPPGGELARALGELGWEVIAARMRNDWLKAGQQWPARP